MRPPNPEDRSWREKADLDLTADDIGEMLDSGTPVEVDAAPRFYDLDEVAREFGVDLSEED